MHKDLCSDRYKSSFEHSLGVKFNEYDAGICEIELEIKEGHLNIGGTTHGGIISSLLDIALSGAVTSTILDKSATQVVTMQMSVNFLRAGLLGDRLKARGEIIKKGSTIVYVEGSIHNQKNDLIAKANGDWFIKRKQ